MGNPPGKFGSYEFRASVTMDWSNVLLAMTLALLGVVGTEVLPSLHKLGPTWGLVAVVATPIVRAIAETLKDNKKKF